MAYNTNVILENTADGYVTEAKNIKGGYFVIDALANIPAVLNVTGAKCYCQADSKTYKYNGSAWVEEKDYSAGNNIAISAQKEISFTSGSAASGKVLKANGSGGTTWGDEPPTLTAGNNIAINQNAISVSSGNAASGKVMTSDGQGGASFLDAPKELPTPTAADGGKSVKVKSDGSGFEFGQFEGLTNPMTAKGDMIYGGTAGAPMRLAKPSEYPASLMILNGYPPQWFRRHKGGSVTSYDSYNEITISSSTISLGPSDAFSARKLIFTLRKGQSEIYSPFMIADPHFSISQDSSNPTKIMAYPADQQKRIEFSIWWDTINSEFRIKIYEIDYQGNRSLYNMSGSTLYWDSYYE